jgi:hypothetical protein
LADPHTGAGTPYDHGLTRALYERADELDAGVAPELDGFRYVGRSRTPWIEQLRVNGNLEMTGGGRLVCPLLEF